MLDEIVHNSVEELFFPINQVVSRVANLPFGDGFSPARQRITLGGCEDEGRPWRVARFHDSIVQSDHPGMSWMCVYIYMVI